MLNDALNFRRCYMLPVQNQPDTDFSIDWLKARDQTKPFFLMCHHKAPHRAWQPYSDPAYRGAVEKLKKGLERTQREAGDTPA